MHVHACLAGDTIFSKDNVRLHKHLDGLGCLGDIGWYCIGHILWAFDHQSPSLVQAHAGAIILPPSHYVRRVAMSWWVCCAAHDANSCWVCMHACLLPMLGLGLTHCMLHLQDDQRSCAEHAAWQSSAAVGQLLAMSACVGCPACTRLHADTCSACTGPVYNENGVLYHAAGTLLWEDGRRAIFDCGYDRCTTQLIEVCACMHTVCDLQSVNQ